MATLEYHRQWRDRRRAERQAHKQTALAAIDAMLERASVAGPDVFKGVLEQAHIAREALEAALAARATAAQ
ncbi:hypothetical protein QCM77_25045 [Bradyrhizobium sp. SSUT18]|uniref:hypothetical protein n=1 Tax=unclassified Bradyrhizobium TaxID=2631580 RepID=UPI00244A0DD3|nr:MULTISPECIES: hypothetical protein [unclassified Bradyrhizobium]MDH2354493.1 hypothetical protein [Bradyrhizobium sp. SSUT112]MDH2403189.1 hypothetical protein [Bradyrhizobium sp. SSUT18]